MKTAFVLFALVAAVSAANYEYDNVGMVTRSDVYVSCGFASYHMWSLYGETLINDYMTIVDMILSFLKDNLTYILLTPYIKDSDDLQKAESLWTWFTNMVNNEGCCDLKMFTYITNTLITTIWSRIDFTQFRELLWMNLNKYTTEGKFYYDQFFMTCPFMYSELYHNYIQPYLP